MSYRRRLLLALLVYAAGVAPLVGYFAFRSPTTQDDVDRIRPGMGLREVEAILGGPGDPAPDSRVLAGLVELPPLAQDFIAETLAWDHGGRTATVFLDGDGVMLEAIYTDRRPGGILQELRMLRL